MKGFRCPFEISARKEGKILTVDVSDVALKFQRIEIIHQAHLMFNSTNDFVALEIIIPDSAYRSDWQDMRSEILLYTAESITAQMKLRVGDEYMPWNIVEIIKELSNSDNEELKKKVSCFEFMCGAAFLRSIQEFEKELPTKDITGDINSYESLSLWVDVQLQMRFAATNNFRTSINIDWCNDKNEWSKIMSFNMMCLQRYTSYEMDEVNRLSFYSNKNLFGIIMGPFYHEKSGRYSKKITMLYTKESDLFNLTKVQKQTIRRKSNTVLLQCGYVLDNDDINMASQPQGLWIPT